MRMNDRRGKPDAFRASLHALAITGMTTAILTAGCSARERICGSDQYPAKAVGNTTGRTCVPNGKELPDGYVRYPKDKVPKYVDDKWDKYWRTIVVDRDGNIVTA